MRVKISVGFLLLAFGLIAACQGSGTAKFSSFAQEGGLLGERLTLLTWKMQKLRDPKIARDLSNLIGQQKPDLVFLQEVKIDQLKLDNMGGHFAKAWSYPWPGGPTTGVLTLSKSSPNSVQSVQTEWREFFVTAPKVSLITEHPLPKGETLLAVNVHLLNFEPWEPFMLRAQLRDLGLVMAQHDGPIIMAGDFNTWSDARLELVDNLARTLGLEEVTGFRRGRKTGDLDLGLLNWVFGVDQELPLDRVYSRGFAAVSAQVLPINSSDHRPVLVTLTLSRDSHQDQEAPLISNCLKLPRMTYETSC